MRQKERRTEAKPILERSLAAFKAINSTRSIIGVNYRLAMLAHDLQDYPASRALAQRGVTDCMAEKWGRLEGFNRRLLGDVALAEMPRGGGNGTPAPDEKHVEEVRYQFKRALELVPRSDMRIQALIEFSLASLEVDFRKDKVGRGIASSAASHFDKLGMTSEAERARRLADGLAPE